MASIKNSDNVNADKGMEQLKLLHMTRNTIWYRTGTLENSLIFSYKVKHMNNI